MQHLSCNKPTSMNTLILSWLLLIAANLGVESVIQKQKDDDCANNKEGETLFILYAHPDNDSKSCPKGNNHICATLTFYVENKSTYFKSSTTFHFLGGRYKHSSNIEIKNVTDLKLLGSSGITTIDCSNSNNSGFAFVNVTRLTILELMFYNCGQVLDFGYGPIMSALAFGYGQDHNITNVAVTYSKQQNVHYNSVEGIISIHNCTFAHASVSNSFYKYAGNAFFFSECKSHLTNFTIERTQFLNNSNIRKKNGIRKMDFASGLLIVLKCTTVTVSFDNVTFDKNSGYSGGNLAVVFNNISHVFTSPIKISNSIIANGIADVGGGMFVTLVEAPMQMGNFKCMPTMPRSLLILENVTFARNKALRGGGALYIRQKDSPTTLCSVAKISIDNCTFKYNTLGDSGHGGVAIHSINFIIFEYVHHAVPQYQLEISNSEFTHNNAHKPSGKGIIFLNSSPHVSLKNVSIHDNKCSGILGIRSNFLISGNVSICNNTGSSGGGILFCSDSVMYLMPYTKLIIANNHAHHTGGGICIEAGCLQSQPMCFFQLDESTTLSPRRELIDTIHVHLINNSAMFAGDGLFGGSVEYCYLLDSPYHNITANKSKPVFNKIFTIESNNSLSNVSSPPQKVCYCNKTPRCDVQLEPISVYPGQSFSLSVAVVGQLNGIVPGTIVAFLRDYKPRIKHITGRVQKTEYKHCNKRYYRIYTNESHETLELIAAITGDDSYVDRLTYFKKLSVSVQLKKCPVGFKLSGNKYGKYLSCKCNSILQKMKFACKINTQILTRHKQMWIGYEKVTGTYLYTDVLAYDYCVANDTITINVSNDSMEQDVQCQYNRTGVLCGACPENYSVILGSSECRKGCTNNYLLLIMVFALAGILLVFILTFLNLTIAAGTLSGLIFYVNIVQLHRPILFQYHSVPVLTNSVLLFISWINLDFGIPVCFYKGMDEYGKAWLQFLFPIYIWMISGVVVLLSRRFDMFAKVFGTNSIKVLATLILLSYSKLLRAIISTIHFQSIYHYSITMNNSVSVLHWKPDANLLFLHGKHIYLFTVGMILLLICFPFTLALLFLQSLQRVSNKCCFTWVWKLKPFFDALTGPYSKSARFWTGLLLITRITLFAVCAVNYNGIKMTNIFATVLICNLLFVIGLTLRPGIYEKRALDVLEFSFLLNLSILCIGTAYTGDDSSKLLQIFRSVLAHVSVLVSFVTFLGIIFHHGSIKFKCLKRGNQNHIGNEVIRHQHQPQNAMNNFPPFVRFDQVREPLLASESEEHVN